MPKELQTYRIYFHHVNSEFTDEVVVSANDWREALNVASSHHYLNDAVISIQVSLVIG